MDRHDLDQLRRSMAAIPPGQPALHREQAVMLLEALADLRRRHEMLRIRLQEILEQDES